jgi:predicted Rossmann fold nucleotide-binding protein DprA/Smf involved in DNA uptake
MQNHILAPDTQAILLLCASFGQNPQIEPLPLTLGEYKMVPPVSKGNEELYNQGAKPFPSAIENCDLREMLAKAIIDFEPVKTEVILKQGINTLSQDLSTTKDIYEVVLPFILNHLRQPKDAKSLADSLKVRKIQMDDWLKRAMEEGKVRKLDKPSAYVLNQADTQLSLL